MPAGEIVKTKSKTNLAVYFVNNLFGSKKISIDIDCKTFLARIEVNKFRKKNVFCKLLYLNRGRELNWNYRFAAQWTAFLGKSIIYLNYLFKVL